MKPRGENIEYDKLRDHCEALQAKYNDLVRRFAHVHQPSVNSKVDACHQCGLPMAHAVHVPKLERNWVEKAVIAGFANDVGATS